MNLKEIQDNAPDGATHFANACAGKGAYFKKENDLIFCFDQHSNCWDLIIDTYLFIFNKYAKPLHPNPKEKEEMKKYGEYIETSYNCGATSSAKISVNSGKHTTADILNERQEQYGKYCDVARITQEIKESLTSGDSYHVLSDEQKLSLDMIANKMARAVNGDVRYIDNLADICGYSQLVVDSLKKDN